ncbi:MAG: hypothetical protein ACT6Q8_13640 [Niveispirillum sp.]|uniref:hypothetical protein n=1 Tax=Niveispirillum sp. TaxID=1917217 RepID=UPI004035984E
MRGPALLVFCHETEIAWLRGLKPGFRHVFVALPAPGGWITIDPLSTLLEVEYHKLPSDTDLAAWFRTRGHSVLESPLHPPLPTQWPFTPLTCVSVAKRILGIRAPLIVTPWQLYRHLGGDPPIPRNIRKEPSILARLVSAPKPRNVSATAAAPAATPAVTTPATITAPTVSGATGPTAGEQSLLRRATGRAGTVLTGWRGVLAPGALAPTRKTLLGE